MSQGFGCPAECGSGLAVRPRAALESSIASHFEAMVDDHSENVALSMGTTQVSYRALNQTANRLAHHLLGMGVGQATILGICMERSTRLFTSLLAILKAGSAYLPLDSEYPLERLALMIHDAHAPIVLCDRASHPRLASIGLPARLVDVDELSEVLASHPDTNPKIQINTDDLAYVMYTSGSTGIPKGVMIPHRGVVRLVRETNYCDFSSDQVFLQMAPITFDASTFEIWGPLLNGGRLAILPPGKPSLADLGTTLDREGVTTLWLTAGLFHLMVDQRPDDLSGLRQLLAGGDVLSPRHVRKALSILKNGVLINGYGPTESTTFACCYRMSDPERVGENVPIGLPISRTTLLVVDDQLQKVPVGTVGELLIGGDGVALGYLNDVDLSNCKFLEDSASPDYSARLYRTGDLVRAREDGVYEFIGRADDQLKILGHRIEPAEIEAALQNHPDVQQSVVVAIQDPRGEKRLVAYLASVAKVDAIKAYLVNRLPAHMIPTYWFAVDNLPLTTNGKVDRGRLPAPDWQTDSTLTRAAKPQNLEIKLTAIWEQALRVAVRPTDNFFDLGGDSLLLTAIHSEIQKQLSIDVGLLELFEHTTIRALAEHLNHKTFQSETIANARERASRQLKAFAQNKALRLTNGYE